MSARQPRHASGEVRLRTDLRPGDAGWIVLQHGLVYAREHGFDLTFEAYVAEPLARCVLAASPRERVWIAERGSEPVGSVAIVENAPGVAQLRWFLVLPEARGAGIGRRLLDASVEFARGAGYASVHLWTVEALTAAARLYRAAGFERAEAVPARRWGVDVVEERYVLELA